MLANTNRESALALSRQLLCVPEPAQPAKEEEAVPVFVCRSCGEPMIIVEVLARTNTARAPPLVIEHQ